MQVFRFRRHIQKGENIVAGVEQSSRRQFFEELAVETSHEGACERHPEDDLAEGSSETGLGRRMPTAQASAFAISQRFAREVTRRSGRRWNNAPRSATATPRPGQCQDPCFLSPSARRGSSAPASREPHLETARLD